MKLYLPVLPGRYPDTDNTRPTYVIEDLSELTVQVAGTVTLPIELNWTPTKAYNADDVSQRQNLYETVLREAHSEKDIKNYINGQELQKIWNELNIPMRVRYAWESVHPKLGLRRFQ